MLGLVLAIGGGVAAARSDHVSQTATTARPVGFAVAPQVRFEAAYPPGPPRTLPARRAKSDARHPAAGRPRRVVVPRLGVAAPVVGIDAPGGVLRPPDDPQVLGWWRSGARPGAMRGSALVTGHTVSSGGGALDHLESLRPGDRVRIGTSSGSIDYRVSRVTIYRKARLARSAHQVFSQSVPGRLVLITCEGWNGTSYESNVVVTAEPVG